ncbi:MAG: hypothetical protein RBG13Loki_0888 [Promethearchaeota archaeon CR_4]|nr:MAG: hypothetical protein RBG13Loki_0888 [Candidatus Lokiarchaeota archaeon CR_4]
MTEGKFGIKPATVYIVNNAYGPDLIGAFFNYNDPIYLFFHGMGWYLVAALMAILWYYLVNGKIEKHRVGPSFFSRIRMEDKEKRLKYWQVYLFCAAAGMSHMFIDIIGHPAYIDAGTLGMHIPWGVVWFGDNFYLSLDWIFSTGLFPCGQLYLPAILLFIGFIVGILLALIWGLRTQNFWNLAKGLLIVLGVTFGILLLSFFIPILNGQEFFDERFGDLFTFFNDPAGPVKYSWLIWLTGGESDFGMMVYLALFFFIPLIMLYYGFKDLPRITPDSTSTSKRTETGQPAAPYLE